MWGVVKLSTRSQREDSFKKKGKHLSDIKDQLARGCNSNACNNKAVVITSLVA